MTDDILRQLAASAGVAPEWTDQTGALRQVAPDGLRAILAALGLPCDTDEALRNSLAAVETLPISGSARFLTARVGQPVDLAATGTDDGDIEAVLENGTHRVLKAERAGDRLRLPAFDEPGYHTLHLAEEAITVAVAPARCVTFSDLTGGRAGWGLAAQIYSLRSAQDGGIGNFAGVEALGRAAAGLACSGL